MRAMRHLITSGRRGLGLALTPILLLVLLLTAACQGRSAEDTATPAEAIAGDHPTVTGTSLAARPAPATTIAASAIPPAVIPGRTATSSTRANAAPVDTNQSFFPLVPVLGSTATATPTPTPTPTTIPSPTPTPYLDFSAIRADLRASGQDLAFAKVGLHVTFLNEAEEEVLYDYLQRLDAAGVPFFLKSASNAEPLFRAQQMMLASGLPHTLVYRSTAWDVPNYELEPEEAAALHWQRHRDAFPPELDPGLVWIETLNEVDRNRSDWLARFALRTAELTMADGFRWAAFSWASGEPEPEDWQSPDMLAFLRLVGNNPDRLAIALHEYSFLANNIGHLYPYKVGRFLDLFRIADENNIPRPTVLITEWGWAYDEVPEAERALLDIHWANTLYAPFSEIKGAALWNLGDLGEKNDLSALVQPIVSRLTDYSLSHYFAVPPPPNRASVDPRLYSP